MDRTLPWVRPLLRVVQLPAVYQLVSVDALPRLFPRLAKLGVGPQVYRFTVDKFDRRIFAIKGKGGQGIPYFKNPPTLRSFSPGGTW